MSEHRAICVTNLEFVVNKIFSYILQTKVYQLQSCKDHCKLKFSKKVSLHPNLYMNLLTRWTQNPLSLVHFIFSTKHSRDADAHTHVHTLAPMKTHMHTHSLLWKHTCNPTPMRISEWLSRQILKIDKVTTCNPTPMRTSKWLSRQILEIDESPHATLPLWRSPKDWVSRFSRFTKSPHAP